MVVAGSLESVDSLEPLASAGGVVVEASLELPLDSVSLGGAVVAGSVDSLELLELLASVSLDGVVVADSVESLELLELLASG